MPEGPEIRLAADQLSVVLEGHVIEHAFFGLAHLCRFQRRLTGSRVQAVDTHGKALLIRFNSGLTLYSHNQLYGRWYVCPRGALPNTNRSLRVALHTADASALLYSASDIQVLTAGQLERHPFLCRLGPDILDPALSWRALVGRLDEAGFRNRAVGGLYLDQGFVAGLGNYLRSEILFFAGVHPAVKPRQLSQGRRDRLARETLAVAKRSYKTRGVTNPVRRARALKATGVTESGYRFAVFGRAGEPCYDCGHTVERVAVSSRRLYLCPRCQA